MHVDHHSLVHDFSEDRVTLQRLRQEDALFARQAEEYEALDKRICRVEDGIELLDDVSLQALKLNRVALKDELARQLKRANGQCCGCGNGCKG
ncbi:YdcH family protein [Pseudomonas sp. SH1-B]